MDQSRMNFTLNFHLRLGFYSYCTFASLATWLTVTQFTWLRLLTWRDMPQVLRVECFPALFVVDIFGTTGLRLSPDTISQLIATFYPLREPSLISLAVYIVFQPRNILFVLFQVLTHFYFWVIQKSTVNSKLLSFQIQFIFSMSC